MKEQNVQIRIISERFDKKNRKNVQHALEKFINNLLAVLSDKGTY